MVVLPFMLHAQGGTEIYLCKMNFINDKPSLSSPVNITQHPGYDNQPFFHASLPVIYYASAKDTATVDIKTYNINTHATEVFASTDGSEFSPTLTPDGKFISCILQKKDGAQNLVKFPVNGGTPVTLIDNLVIGYHAWINDNDLLLFVLDDTVNNSLHCYNLKTKEDKIIIKNPGRSLHKIPGENAMSFVDKSNDKEWLIKKFNIKTKTITTITSTLPNAEDMAWLNNGMILMSDGLSLFYYDTHKPDGWKKIEMNTDSPALKGIKRLAVNKENTMLALVAEEVE